MLDGFATQNIDTTTSVGELAFNMTGAIAQFERRLISERVSPR
ncbi:recombinase family protein [Vibrio splendidus]|nr:recombinase family protein [Vibrio splendidus]